MLGVFFAELIIQEYSQQPLLKAEMSDKDQVFIKELEEINLIKKEKEEIAIENNKKENILPVEEISSKKSEETPSASEKVSKNKPQKITTDRVRAFGFPNSRAKSIDFYGKILNFMHAQNIDTNSIYQQNITKGNDILAYSFQINLLDIIDAKDYYEWMQGEIITTYTNFELNETNLYGDNSFYINSTPSNELVMLVVRIRENIYAFTYKAEMHDKIISLIKSLY
jgi:hypothetical protein